MKLTHIVKLFLLLRCTVWYAGCRPQSRGFERSRKITAKNEWSGCMDVENIEQHTPKRCGGRPFRSTSKFVKRRKEVKYPLHTPQIDKAKKSAWHLNVLHNNMEATSPFQQTPFRCCRCCCQTTMSMAAAACFRRTCSVFNSRK